MEWSPLEALFQSGRNIILDNRRVSFRNLRVIDFRNLRLRAGWLVVGVEFTTVGGEAVCLF